MSFFESNKEILLKTYPGFWEELTSSFANNDQNDSGLSPDAINVKNENEFSFDDILIENSAAGDPSLCIKGVYVHSRRDPLREGQRLAQTAGAENGIVVILGFGLGYAAEAAAKFGRPVVIVEKHRNLFLKALELRDFNDLFTKNQLILIIGSNADGILSALEIASVNMPDTQSAADSAGDARNGGKVVSIIANKALVSLDEHWYKVVENKIRTWTMRDNVNAATHKRFGTRWVRNLSRNMSTIRDLPGVSHLAGLAMGKNLPQTNTSRHEQGDGNDESPLPVFLAAAGPSLDRIKPMLRDIYDRCVVAAVDTSLRFFVKNGIEPDFVVVVDPQFWNCRHLDRCVCGKTALIAESAVYPPVMNLSFNNKFLCGSFFPLGEYIEKQVDPKGRLGAGGSVATTAWDFARLLGAKEIWIAGLDLAFPGFKTHFRGARFEDISNSLSNRFNPVEKWVTRALRDGNPFKARCAAGGQVLTDQRLSLYGAWFENQFNKNPQIHNYALFQEGLEIAGLQPADEKKFLELPVRRGEINRRITSVLLETENVFNSDKEKQDRSARYEEAVSLLKRGLEKIRSAAEDGAEIARKALRYPVSEAQQGKVLKELDDVMRHVNESDVKDVAGFLFSPDSEKENESGTEKDPFKAYLKSIYKLFSSIAKAARINFM